LTTGQSDPGWVYVPDRLVLREVLRVEGQPPLSDVSIIDFAGGKLYRSGAVPADLSSMDSTVPHAQIKDPVPADAPAATLEGWIADSGGTATDLASILPTWTPANQPNIMTVAAFNHLVTLLADTPDPSGGKVGEGAQKAAKDGISGQFYVEFGQKSENPKSKNPMKPQYAFRACLAIGGEVTGVKLLLEIVKGLACYEMDKPSPTNGIKVKVTFSCSKPDGEGATTTTYFDIDLSAGGDIKKEAYDAKEAGGTIIKGIIDYAKGEYPQIFKP
jgi:hypothetical protein